MINKIEFISGDRAWAFCTHHKDNNRPNVSITLSPDYYGSWKCWACQAHGKLSKKEMNKLNLKEHKIYKSNKKMSTRWSDLVFSYKKKLNLLPLLKQGLANEFNINPAIINSWNIGYDGNAFTIPMFMSYMKYDVCGIQRRFPDGKKCCVTGSKLGLMFPTTTYITDDPLFICEGFSDAICVNDLGFNSIARPHCYFNDLDEYLALEEWNNIIIVPDNDEVGIKGAQDLYCYLDEESEVTIFNIAILKYKGAKDIRELIQKKDKSYVTSLLKGYC